MEGDDRKAPGPLWKPNWKELLGEGYKEIFKAVLLGVGGWLGLLLARELPGVGEFLKHTVRAPLYLSVLVVASALLIGFCVDRLVVGRRLRRLNEEATKDELTGLLNLRAQKRALPVEMRAARERQKALDAENRPVDKDGLCAILLDVDNFKQVNDTAGYESGNFVFQQFAELLASNRKVTDQVFRFGGDEFLILAPRTPRQGALMYAEKLRGTIAGTKFKVHDGQPDALLTISAGITPMLFPGKDTPEDLLKRANGALTRAKQKKNCIEMT